MPVSIEGFGSGVTSPVALAIELHEDQIPDFDVAAAVAAECAIGVALIGSRRAHVVMDFAARAARAGIAHGPEVFLQPGNGDDAVARRADVDPQLERLFVGTEHHAGSDFGAAEDGEVELVDAGCANLPAAEVISSQANATASFLK